MTRVRDALGGKQFFVTGATGFLGTALVERLLRTVPDSRVVLLIRPGRRSTAGQRAAKEILKNDCFDRLRQQHGERFETEVAARVVAVAGDVTTDGLGLDEEGRQLLSECDIVVHSAAAVSFDSPLDTAVEVNLLGPSRVAAAVAAARVLASEQGRHGPLHYLPVSTAYVAGSHQGEAKEELLDGNPFTVSVDWRAEVAAARRQRGDLDAESRRPQRLASFTKEARVELGGAGLHLLAERAERLREDWVKKQMVAIGQARAQSLGWPDAYPYTKALGERALVSQFGEIVPLTIIRPSIIESALAEPRPGWIRGFRMAEPIIVSYARGLLREFPGVPEGVTDVIPVDLVVAAILAVAGEALLMPAEEYRARASTTWPRACGIRSATGAWWNWSRPGSPSIPSTTATASPLWCRPGRSPAEAGSSGSSPGPARRWTSPKRWSGPCPSAAGRPIVDGRPRGTAPPGRSGTRLRRALWGIHRDRGALRVDRLMALWDRMDDDDRQALCLDPGGGGLGHLRP